MNAKKKKNIKSFQLFSMFFIAIFIGSVFALTSINFAYAATILSTNINGLNASYDNGQWTASGATLSGTATGKNKSGCDAATSVTSTLTLKNTKGSTATLSFNYKITQLGTGGTLTVDGTSGSTTSSSFSKTLANNASIKVVLYSGNAGSNTTKAELSNVSLVSNTNSTITFKMPQGSGSYTVNGTAVTTQYSSTASSTTNYALVATAATNYRFFGWYVDDSLYSSNASMSFQTDKNVSIYPYFILKDAPVFQVSSSATFGSSGDKYIFDLGDAITYASSNSKSYIIVTGNGIVEPKKDSNNNIVDYVIPSGVKFLVPRDDAHSMDGDSPIYEQLAYTTPSTYVTLTLAANTSISVNGTMEVASKYSINGQVGGTNGAPSGPHGKIVMNAGSIIKLNKSAKLYCWGYITGTGTVEAFSGSTVREYFQIRDFRGGTHTTAVLSDTFPFNQYYIQNIEASLKIHKGATESLKTGLTVKGLFGQNYYPTDIPFIGTNSMFRFSNDSTSDEYFLKTYDGSKDQLVLDVHGNMNISSMSISIAGNSLNSSNYNLPITNNIKINIHANASVTITNQNTTLLPGVEINIDENGTLNVDGSSKLFVYDKAEYHGKQISSASATDDVVLIAYAPGKTYTRTKTPDDAKIKVNGTIYVNGGLFTSASGANIYSTSDNPGVITYSFTSSKEKTATVTENVGTSSKTQDITFQMAKLKNGDEDGTYVSIKDYYELPKTDKTLEHDFEYDGATNKWDGHESDGIEYQMTFIDPRYPNFQVVYPDSNHKIVSGEKFTFPTKDVLLAYIDTYYKTNTNYNANAFKNGDLEILMWTANNTYFKAGVETEDKIGVKKTPFNLVWGGWIDEDSVHRYLIKSTALEWNYAVGLYRAETFMEGTSDYPIFKLLPNGTFDSNYTGLFTYVNNSDYPNGDNQTYFVEGGIVRETPGLFFYGTNYYYLAEDNHIIKNQIIYVDIFNDVQGIEPGYYSFDSYGVMSTTPVQKSKPTSIKNGVAYVTYDTQTADNYGLFAYNNNLYYAGDNGQLIVNCSFYVSLDMINGCKIGETSVTAGLYYFDEQGRMYDANLVLITNGVQS